MATRRIVLGLDGSDGAAVARAWCVQCAPPLDAEVVAVHVLDLGPLYFGPATVAAMQPPIAEVRRDRAEMLDGWAAPLRSAGVHARTKIVDGLPAPMLDQVAVDEDADLIVVGRRGNGGFAALLLGSVPNALGAPCAPAVAHRALRLAVADPPTGPCGFA